MKTIVTNCTVNPHPRVDVGIDCSDELILKRQEDEKTCLDWELPSQVDHAAAKACDVNVIVASFAKQGIAPKDIPGRVGEFLDNTQIPTFYQAFDILENAKRLFEDLPPRVRNALGGDPALMESYFTDPSNYDFLVKEGVLVEKPKIDPDAAPLDRKTFKEIMNFKKAEVIPQDHKAK